MIASLESIRGYKLKSKDGEFGRIRNILVEEETWTGCWLVADTGDWLLGKNEELNTASKEPESSDNFEGMDAQVRAMPGVPNLTPEAN